MRTRDSNPHRFYFGLRYFLLTRVDEGFCRSNQSEEIKKKKKDKNEQRYSSLSPCVNSTE